jgi:hypothetical protein
VPAGMGLGEVYPASISFTMPDGRLEVNVVVDSAHAVVEEDEFHNQTAIELGVPPAPADLRPGVSNRGGAVFLSWTAPEAEIEYYRIYRAVPDEPFRLVGRATTPAYVDMGMASGARQRYVVTAVNSSAVESARSNEVQVTPAWPHRLHLPLVER